MEDGSPIAIRMEGITKRFPGVVANRDIDFAVESGEIHALLGENGAGKTTLMKILNGLYQPDEGQLWVDGQQVFIRSPRDAIDLGIGMVHQHFMLVPTQTATENILLGLPKPRFHINLEKYDKEILALQEKFGLYVDVKSKVWQLSVGEQQRVEILKTLYRGADILILDEPTAVLAPQEIDELMATMRSLVEQGKSIIFISHKLHEVAAVADRITVLRKGVGTAEGIPMEGLDKRKLAQLMVGRDVIFRVEKDEQKAGDVALSVRDLKALNNKGVPALRGMSFDLHNGEILGIAGVAGNGQSELAECITGMRPCEGSILVNGKELANAPPIQAIRAGISHVPEDRTHVGTAPNLSITDNTIMKNYRAAPIGNGVTINRNNARAYARSLKQAYDIMAPSVRTMVRKLSGGNLQKVILAREISAEPALMVAVQPTRGLDVGAIESIQQLLLEQRANGTAVLLVSEELEELLALSDRIAVVFHGQIMGIIDAAAADISTIGLMMTGTRLEDIRQAGEVTA